MFVPAEVCSAFVHGTCTPLYCARARVVVIRGVHWNLNLRDVHDAMYGPAGDDNAWFIVTSDALILSRSPDFPAVRTGTWPRYAAHT